MDYSVDTDTHIWPLLYTQQSSELWGSVANSFPNRQDLPDGEIAHKLKRQHDETGSISNTPRSVSQNHHDPEFNDFNSLVPLPSRRFVHRWPHPPGEVFQVACSALQVRAFSWRPCWVDLSNRWEWILVSGKGWGGEKLHVSVRSN